MAFACINEIPTASYYLKNNTSFSNAVSQPRPQQVANIYTPDNLTAQVFKNFVERFDYCDGPIVACFYLKERNQRNQFFVLFFLQKNSFLINSNFITYSENYWVA